MKFLNPLIPTILFNPWLNNESPQPTESKEDPQPPESNLGLINDEGEPGATAAGTVQAPEDTETSIQQSAEAQKTDRSMNVKLRLDR
jgi:hypothetical protein